MFGFFKKKAKNEVTPELELFAVAEGEVVPITEINDPVFSQKFMGDGYAVLPTSGVITSPVVGEVINVFPTKHAVGIKTDNGVEVLLHMGIDTVELQGAPFDTVVTVGQRVDQNTVISTVDLEAVKAAGKDTPMIVALTNMDKIASLSITTGNASVSSKIGEATVNL